MGNYGYFVNPFNIESIAFAMNAVINDKNASKKLFKKVQHELSLLIGLILLEQ